MWSHKLGIFVILALLPGIIETAAVPTSFGCRNSLISDQWRAMVLNFHNDKRGIVSAGQQNHKTGAMPTAKKMNELAWDCNLEKEAQETAESCGATYGGQYSINEEMFKANPCNVTKETRTVLNKWWNEVRSATLNNDNEYDKTTIPHFGNMAYHESTIMACSHSTCSGKTNLVCLYENKPTDGDPLYENGPTCNDCQNACINKLCQPNPVNHIADPMTTCQNGKMSDEMVNAALNMHNYYRRVIATGWAKDPKSVYAPRASKMTALTYDCANYATDAANKIQPAQTLCLILQRASRTFTRFQTGNLHARKHLNRNPPNIVRLCMEIAISSWYNELEKSGGIGDTPTYKDDMKTRGLANYVNLANEANTVVGCAVKTCQQKGFTLVACQYDSILIDDDPIYTTGKPCSKCSATTANKQCETASIKGLCVA